ncbi:MAG: D-alanine--D-alanine ligase [Candidatus Competibacteraceae bacterium]|nr:D-alanine--D-alanine ligase [Candidatus Competibacteraceae bacterium]
MNGSAGRNARPVVILYGAVPANAPADEQDVLVEVATVEQALISLGYPVQRLALTLDLAAARRQLLELRPRLVFNLVESLAGSGQYIHCAPALLDELGLPYTGAPLNATFLSSNKLLAKQWLQQAGIATPPWLTPASLAQAVPETGPWFVKSVWEHASIGLDDNSLVATANALSARLAERQARYGGSWFAERYIDGREFNLALLEGPQGMTLLPPAEIVFHDYPPGKPRIVGYAAKWDEHSFEFQNTPRRFDFAAADQPLLRQLNELAQRCSALFGLRGYARVDFRVDAHNQPWVLEINTNPCLSPDAGFAAALAQAGLSLRAAVAHIVTAALPSTNRMGTETAGPQHALHSQHGVAVT